MDGKLLLRKVNLLIAVAVLSLSSQQSTASDKYLPHIDLGGYYFTSTPHDAAFTGIFLPIAQDPRNLFYADIRGLYKGNNGNAKEGNFGLSYRHLTKQEESMYGVYAFYDRKKSTTGNYFSQATIGYESWLQRLFLGLNYYQPTGTRSVATNNISANGSLTASNAGLSNILISETTSTSYDVAMVGADATIGYQVTDRLESFAGGYYYHSSSAAVAVPSTTGALIKLRYGFFNKNGNLMFGAFQQITLEGQLQYDHLGGTRLYAGARFGLGVGPSKLSQMQRHMTEQSLRDIDLVIDNRLVTSNRKYLATKSDGSAITVQQVSTTLAFDSAIGDPNVSVIAVQGTLNGVNSTAKTLASGQTVTGGSVVLYANGIPVTVQVSNGGELVGAAAQNILKVGNNNTIRDITLTTVSPPTTGGNKAIYDDSAINDLGTLTISNVKSNAIITISRTGAAQQGYVQISNCNFNTPSTWNPTDLPAVAQFTSASSANLSVTLQNNTFKANASTQQVVGVGFLADSSSVLTIPTINNNTISGTDSGMNLAVRSNGSLIVTGDIAYNTISGGSPALLSEVGLDIFSSLAQPATIHVYGAIKNNQISGTSIGVFMAVFSANSTSTFTFDQGFQNNTIRVTNSGSAFITSSNTKGTFNIANVFNNTLTPAGAANYGFNLSGSLTTIRVGQGLTGLSAANHNASISATGVTIIPGQ